MLFRSELERACQARTGGQPVFWFFGSKTAAGLAEQVSVPGLCFSVLDNTVQTFILHSSYQPQGDQPQAIEELTKNIEQGVCDQVLLGVTGSGKTFTMANVIARTGRPTLIMAPNKTLAAQLFNEFREIFPENAVEYFVSYYDYYQPEAYLPHSDVYIEKDASINEEKIGRAHV